MKDIGVKIVRSWKPGEEGLHTVINRELRIAVMEERSRCWDLAIKAGHHELAKLIGGDE